MASCVTPGIKVFVIGPRGFPGVQGGIERFSEGLYPGLVKMGYKVVSFALKRFSPQKEWMGIQFIHLPSPQVRFLEKPVYNFFATLHCIFRRPDIVHVHSIASGMFIFMLKIFRLKVVARYNSRDYLHSKWNFWGKVILKISERQFFLADHIITNNKDFLLYFNTKGRTKNISYIPNGVELFIKEKYLRCFDDFFSETLEKDKFILFVGRVTPEKNIDTLINAFIQLKDKNMKLAIAGDTAHDDNYFSLLKEKYSSDYIVFLGKIDRQKLNCLYANCHLFVIPSFYEGTPNVLLEAMSFNCRILASSIPAHLEFGFEKDTYFEPENIGELKLKIKQKLSSLENPDYSLLLTAHQWPEIIERIHSIHQSVISSNQSAVASNHKPVICDIRF